MPLRSPFIKEENIAVFLDVDGTLIEIAATPDAVRVPAGLRNTLQLASAREGGALALVSGRSIAVIDALFAPCVFPIAGQHGLERRDAYGRLTAIAVNRERLNDARRTLFGLQAAHKGLLLEDKGTSLTMHYRLAPQLESKVRETVLNLLVPLADEFELRLGKCVFEIAPKGCSKRSAIEAFMAEKPFVGRVPVFVGDDVTDEDGFDAVNAMGGYSIRVGHSDTTAARYRFGSVSGVIAWLRERNINR